jgi:DNA polymerase III delta subunit
MIPESTSLLSKIKNGAGARCVLLFGDDLRVQETAQGVINTLVPQEERAFNVERYDGRATAWDRVEAALMTPPFFTGIKVVWVEDAPYFISREQKGELGHKVMQLWSDGKQQDAGKLLIDLLVVEGWTRERWEGLQEDATRAISELLDTEAEQEVEKLLAFCRSQEIDFNRRRSAQFQGLETLLERGLPPWSFLLMTTDEVDKRIRLYKRLDGLGAVVYLGLERDRGGRVSRDNLLEFINQRLRERGKTADAQVREMIAQRSPADLRGLGQELEKLFLYAGERTVLRAQDVESISTDHGEAWVFELTRAIADRNPHAAFSHLARLLASGEPPLKLLGALAGEARRLLAARQLLDGELRGRWRRGMSYAQFQQVLAHGTVPQLTRSSYGDYMCLLRVERLSLSELRRYMGAIHDADLRLKSSGNSPRSVLERLILGMCSGERKRTGEGAWG